MNLTGSGRGATPPSNPQALESALKPVTNVAAKAAKAGQIKSVKLKIKMKGQK